MNAPIDGDASNNGEQAPELGVRESEKGSRINSNELNQEAGQAGKDQVGGENESV